jgi:hypothetical protein
MPRRLSQYPDADGRYHIPNAQTSSVPPRRGGGAGSTLVVALAVLAALAGGAWYWHHQDPRGFAAAITLPGQNPALNNRGPGNTPITPTPANNALLSALRIQVIQLRLVPTTWESVGHATVAFGDLEVRVTNVTDRPLTLHAQRYVFTGCPSHPYSSLQPVQAPEYPPAPGPLWSAVQNIPVTVDGQSGFYARLFLTLAPHQTKTGWIGGDVLGCPHVQLVVTDEASPLLSGGVWQVAPLPPPGPPITGP